MARTDDDSWDITESVGATALGVAMGRAAEAYVENPLFNDPYAQYLLDAATEHGWHPSYTEAIFEEMAAEPGLIERMQAMHGYTAVRTRFFDDFFTVASADGIDQAVILGAGLDARAWRLPWLPAATVYEIDQPKVLAFKTTTLRERNVEPRARHVAVPIDLRQDWPTALREAGFDSSRPTAWSAEGLLPYLPADGQDLLFARLQELSAPGSRIAVEALGESFFDPQSLADRGQDMQIMREAAGKVGIQVGVTTDLWYLEERADVADWLADRGWQVTDFAATDLMARCGRPAPEGVEDAVFSTVFVEGRRV
ncbi:class I SAM-dependent methyltransferase [Mycobacterium sp. E2479]|uniref:class I SAM-dependent methyltransferase n=1 Tax=Mycobacterium sp. E2479 TaxID=1834134 RepID=UPI0007FBCB33|nr:class I SAM-dependent methyltransferase [Mycobacterium sp. E2479]OBH49271.1 SAM-dependent methyltransferase [Mycobacterium sp. E2479]